jgi:hypothetical protein
MKVNVRKGIDAYRKMMEIQGDSPEEIDATLKAVRIERENEIGSQTIQLVNIIILALTAGIILWYSAETKRLADLTAKQIQINIKPIIAIISVCRFKLKNIGKSPALNILVKDITHVDKASNKTYTFKFTEIPVCGAGEERGAAIIPYCDSSRITASGEVEQIIRFWLDCSSLSQGQSYELIVDYEDIEKGKWRSISIVDNEGAHFKEIRALS